MNIEQPVDDSLPIWRLGFRPFFLLAALFSVVAIPLWVAIFSGNVRPVGLLNPIVWHAHEMIYGYGVAVIAGFILTASQNWTGIRGIHGGKLIALTLLWIAGRILISSMSYAYIFVALVDLSFCPVLGLCLIPYLKGSDMKIERIFFVYFALFFCGNLLVHLDALGLLQGMALRGLLLGLYTTMIMIIFMGGRVIPFFTESSISKSQPRSYAWIEVLSHVSAWGFLVSQFADANSFISAGVAFAAAVIHLIRLFGWQVRRVHKVPLIWVLHVAYLWIVVGFLLSGFVSLGVIAQGPAVHSFTIGALGGMTYGMMSRVSLGHTGRRLHPSAWIVVGYYLLNAAALIRVIGPLVAASFLKSVVIMSGFFWVVAYGIFLLIYVPMLFTSRADVGHE